MKKLTRKMVSFLLVLSLVLPTVRFGGTVEVYAGEEGDWSYEVTENNGVEEITITGYKGQDKDVEIPDSFEGKKVTGIGYFAFYGCNSLSSITIPEGVTSIWNGAFSDCSNLSSITIPESVTSIGNGAFSGCSSLGSIIIPESVTSIGDSTFWGCSSLSSIIIPESVTSIGDYAFSGCSSLSSIIIPEGVTSIGESVFEKCNNLSSITIPESVISIGNGAFLECSSLSNITIPESVTGIGTLVFYRCYSLSNITIPEGVTSIGDRAFEDCVNLSSITIPKSVMSIGESAFGYCANLSNITIPESVTSIGEYAFSECSDLSSITVDSKNKVYDSRNNCNAIIETLSNTLLIGCINTIIPEGVTSIGKSAFSGCRNLSGITIPESVTSIGNGAFSGCSSLSSIIIPESVTSIGGSTFSGCSSLSSIIIPESVTSIGDYAFSSCSSLSSIIIPESVTNIGDGAFSGCSSLSSIIIPESVMSIGESAFSWCDNLSSITIPESVMSIGNGAFSGCRRLSSIIIPESVTRIGASTFYGCSSLNSISMPDSVGIIENWAFDGCSPELVFYCSKNSYAAEYAEYYGIKVEYVAGEEGDWSYEVTENNGVEEIMLIGYKGQDINVEIPDSFEGKKVTGIGYEAFYECSNLSSITIPESITSIGNGAFRGCSNLSNITIPEGVTSIADNAFWGCGSLNSITVDSKNKVYDSRNNCNAIIETLSGKLLRGCKNTIIVEGVTKIGNSAFSGCSNLSSITIPESVTSIGNGAFSGCSSLSSITVDSKNKVYDSRNNCNAVIETVSKILVIGCKNTIIPEGVTEIGADAFSGCSSLRSIVIPKGVTYIGTSAFSKCNSLSNIEIPEGVKAIGNGAFFGCSSLSNIEIPEGVEDIGNSAFSGCSSLSSISIPDSVGFIEDEENWVFDGCSPELVFYCSKNSYAAEYAEYHGIKVDFAKRLNNKMIEISLENSSYEYDGKEKTPAITVKDGETVLKEGTDYTVTYEGNTGAGDAKTIVTGKGNYSGSVEKTFAITRRSIATAEVELEGSSYEYDGKEKTPAVTVKDDETVLKEGTDYTVTYEGNTGAGDAKVIVTGKGNYSGSVEKTFAITGRSIAEATVTLESASYEYDGKEKTPAVTVKDGETVLKEGTDYTVTYEDNTEAGKANAIITGKGNYTGSIEKAFEIKEVSISAPAGLKQSAGSAGTIKITWKKAGDITGYEVYRSTKAKGGFKKTASVKGNAYTDKKLKPGTNYYYKVRSFKKNGDSTITSSYSSVYKAVTAPDAAKVTLKAGKRQFKASWKKVRGAVKYEVYIASSKNGRYKKAAVTNGVSYTKKKLKKGQKCYVKVRSYAVDGKGRKWYSAYSSIKSVKVK